MISFSLLSQSYRGQRVLVTGHTGFKGSWLCAWLKQLNADVIGVSLVPPSSERPNLFDAAHISKGMTSFIQDINDYEALKKIFDETQPEMVFYLAAQALVRASYRDPVNTYLTNVVGTTNVLEAARHCSSVIYPKRIFLRLDASKAEAQLGWRPALNIQELLALTAEWYKTYYLHPEGATDLLNRQIAAYQWS